MCGSRPLHTKSLCWPKRSCQSRTCCRWQSPWCCGHFEKRQCCHWRRGHEQCARSGCWRGSCHWLQRQRDSHCLNRRNWPPVPNGQSPCRSCRTSRTASGHICRFCCKRNHDHRHRKQSCAVRSCRFWRSRCWCCKRCRHDRAEHGHLDHADIHRRRNLLARFANNVSTRNLPHLQLCFHRHRHFHQRHSNCPGKW